MIKPLPVLWLMGPTSAGKTTLARSLVERLSHQEKLTPVHWDGDDVRNLLGEDLDFSPESRLRVVRALVLLASITSESGVLTIVSALTAHEDARQLVRESLPQLLSVYTHCPLDICIERDPKGLYQKAKAGEIDTLIGYNEAYTPPEAPDLEINTSSLSVEAGVEALVEFLKNRGVLAPLPTDATESDDSWHE